MDRPQRLEIDDVVDLVLPVNDDEYQEAVTGQPADGLDGDGMPLEQGEDPTGPNPGGAAGVDAHDGQTTGDGQVAGPSGLQGGAIANPVEASTMGVTLNPVPRNGLVTQAMHVDGVQAPGAVPSVRFRPPDPSEQYVLPRMPYSRVEHLPAMAQEWCFVSSLSSVLEPVAPVSALPSLWRANVPHANTASSAVHTAPTDPAV